MTLKNQLQEDIKAAMRAKAADRLTTLRLVTAAIKQKEVDERIELDDLQVISVIEKMVKQRKDAIEQFRAGAREDLVQKESAELVLLQTYLPAQLSEAELRSEIQIVLKTIQSEDGQASPAVMGKAMGQLKQRLAGRADFALVARLLKEVIGS